MGHLPFDIICRIADEDIKQDEMAAYLTHWNSCPLCQQEVELQRSILRVSRQTQLISPSNDFVQNVLDTIIPSKKKRWYEWMLHNMGNMIAMTSVLAFLGYVFSITENNPFQNSKPTRVEPIMEFIRIIQDGSNQLAKYLTSKSIIQIIDTSQTHTIAFALLAIVLLVFIDQIAVYFFRQFKA